MLDEIADLFLAQRRLDAAIDRRLPACEVRGITVTERGRCTRSWLVEELQVSSKKPATDQDRLGDDQSPGARCRVRRR
ncbi:MAG TPA: hypothetical protein VHV79_08620 [Mycobacteriales bacterium]|jgi:ribonuclease I|nr:hypothetical protein [Mycobacteriales bacterium]